MALGSTVTFNEDNYCPDCIVGKLPAGSGQAFDGWKLASGVRMSVEDNLNEIAAAFGINRDDESSFDSGEFPLVLSRDMLSTNDECVECGEPSDTHSDDHAFVDPGDRCGSCGVILGES